MQHTVSEGIKVRQNLQLTRSQPKKGFCCIVHPLVMTELRDNRWWNESKRNHLEPSAKSHPKDRAEETQRWDPLHSLWIPLGILRIRSAYPSYTKSVLFSRPATSFIFINVMQVQMIDSHFSRSPKGYSHCNMILHTRQDSKISERNTRKGHQDKPAW